MEKLSAVVITYNEEKNIGRCLASLQEVADEIVVIDSFSTDRTEEISLEFGARFIKNAFEGHIEQKNFAWQQAHHDYVLSLDADEELSEELKKSIMEARKGFKHNGYTFNRLTNYCGKWIRHSGWYPDKKMRLFKKGAGAWGGVNPHDRFALHNGEQGGYLQGDLHHYTFYTVEEHKAQVKKFTDISSKAMFDLGKRSNWLKIIFHPIAKFLKSYFILRGFMDGYHGWLICSISAKATYLKYTKLLKLQQAANE